MSDPQHNRPAKQAHRAGPRPAPSTTADHNPRPEAPRVLIAVSSRVERESLTAKLTSRGMVVEPVATPADALAAVATERFDLAMVQQAMGRGRGLELVRGLRELDGGLGVVMLARRANLEDTVGAMREGVLDFVIGAIETAALAERVEQAVARARTHRAHQAAQQATKQAAPQTAPRAARPRTLRDLATPLPPPAESGPELLEAYNELAEQMASVGLAAEFNSLVRQELDLESLLRTVLEFVLAKLGPTNAAIFLPGTTGDYTLGAYVNYDCPRDTAEVLLDHLACVLPERFEDATRTVLMRSEQALVERLDDHADWLDGHAVACLACTHDDECLAVLTLFRDRRTGFADDHVATLDALATPFAMQLARVIHVHHRHVPKEQWGLDTEQDRDGHPNEPRDAWEDDADDYGMAA